MDGFKPSTKNRPDFIPDGFLPFMDGLKPSRNGDFFVVIQALDWEENIFSNVSHTSREEKRLITWERIFSDKEERMTLKIAWSCWVQILNSGLTMMEDGEVEEEDETVINWLGHGWLATINKTKKVVGFYMRKNLCFPYKVLFSSEFENALMIERDYRGWVRRILRGKIYVGGGRIFRVSHGWCELMALIP
jgi:hypothetical protein